MGGQSELGQVELAARVSVLSGWVMADESESCSVRGEVNNI